MADKTKILDLIVKSNAEDINKDINDIDKSSGKASKGIGGMGKALKGVGTAFKALGIGLVIAAVAGLTEAFSRNEKITKGISTILTTVGNVFSQVTDAIVDTYEAIASSSENFDALGKVVKGLLTIAMTPLKLTFYAIKLGIQETQLAWEKSFFGDKDPKTINDLNTSIRETKDSILEVGVNAIKAGGDVVDNFKEAAGEIGNMAKTAVKEFSEVSISVAYEQAKAYEVAKDSAIEAAAQQALLVERYDRQAEQLRQIRDEERNSIADRKKANDELLLILDTQEKAMLKQADLQIRAARLEVQRNGNAETRAALIDALANKEGVLAQIEGLRSEQKANDLALDKEQIELTNSKLESESKLSIERKKFNAEQIDDELLRLEALREVYESEAELERERLENIVNSFKEGTQARRDAQIALDNFQEGARQKQLINEKEISDATIKIKRKEEKAKTDSLQAYANMAVSIGGLLGRETVAGKALSVASALVSTYLSAQKAYESQLYTITPDAPIRAAIAAGVAVASGLANVKAILSVKVPNVGGGNVGGGVTSPRAPRTPNFNIVGGSETSQLAQTINDKTQEPIKAYVVANDVKTATELDRNIINGASI